MLAVIDTTRGPAPVADCSSAGYGEEWLDWAGLSDKTPPPREWAVEDWLGMGHVTLLAGRGGIGKSLIAQQIGAHIALGRPFIGKVPKPRRVLMWSCEDDHDELWRRQCRIAAQMGVPVSAFASKFFVVSLVGSADTTLLEARGQGRLEPTPLLDSLRNQIDRSPCDVVILDNASQVFGGNENSRQDVTRFIAALRSAASGRDTAILLLGHVGRATGSEWSGSTAWENAVRARLWLSDRPPDQNADDKEDPATDIRFLARRKANYSPHDLCSLRYEDGVLIPQEPISTGRQLFESIRRRTADRVILEGFRKLRGMGLEPTNGKTTENFLPRAILDHNLGEGLSKRELSEAMHRAMTDGKLRRAQVGHYGNRAAKFGLQEVCTNYRTNSHKLCAHTLSPLGGEC